jgi:hypothetical protein
MRLALLVFLLAMLAHTVLADYELFYQNGKAGVRDDETGTVLIPATFDALGWSDGSFTVINSVTGYRREGRWGLINLKKELVTEPRYENLTSGGGDRVVASRWINPYTKKFGCLDLHGTVTVPFRYEAIQILGLHAIVCVRNGARYEWGVIDLNDKSILKVAYRDVKPVGTLRFAVQDFSKKTALFSEAGERLTDFSIDSISAFQGNVALIYEDLKVGAMDRSGVIVVPPLYQQIEINGDGMRGKTYPVWKEIDSKNQEVRRIVADLIEPEGDHYIITLGKTQGIVNNKFEKVIAPAYQRLEAAGPYMHVAYKDGRAGLIRNNGSVVIPFEHDALFVQNDLMRALQVRGGQKHWTVYDTFGVRKTERTYGNLMPFNGRYFPAQRNGYWGAVDRSGKEIMPCVYDSIINSSYELTAVRFKGLYGIVNRTENWIVPLRRNPLSVVNDNVYFERSDSILFVKDVAGQIIYFTTNDLTVTTDGFIEKTPEGNIKTISWQGISAYLSAPPSAISAERVFEESEGYRGIQRDGRYGFIDTRGRLRIANRYEDIGKFSGGLAPVKILGKWGFVNTGDRVVINPNYQEAGEFINGVSIVRRNNAYGLISTAGNVLLPLRYDSINRSGDKLLIYSNGKTGMAALSGHVLIEPRFDSLRVLPGNLVIVSNGNSWGVITEDGMPVIPMVYRTLIFNERSGNFIAMEDPVWTTLSGLR